MSNTKPILAGQCACGLTTWTSTSIPTHLDFCYCTACQQVTGAPFGAWIGLKRSSLEWEGHTAKFRINDLATRSLCVQCGATLTIQYDCYPEKTHLAAGLVVKGAELIPKVGLHLFVRSKPVWYSIPDDGIPRAEEFDDDFYKVLKKYQETAPKSGLKLSG